MTQGFYGDSTEGGEPAPAVPGSFGPLSFEEWLTQYFPTLSPTEGGALGTQPAWYASALAMYQSWLETGEVGTIDNPGGTPIPPTSTDDPTEPPTPPIGDQDAFQALKDELERWGVGDLATWAWDLHVKGHSMEYILSEATKTDIFKQAFPEYEAAIKAGNPMTVSQIIQYRSDAREMARRILGTEFADNISNADMVQAIIAGKSIDELTETFDIAKQVLDLGGAVQQLFEDSYGFKLDDDELWDLFDTSKSTPELRNLYEDAFYRGFGTKFGLDVLPQEVADALQGMGITEDMFLNRFFGSRVNNQNIIDLHGAYAKLSGIDAGLAGINASGNDFFNDTPLGELVKGLLLEAPDAKRKIQMTLARELARFTSSGGAATSGTTAVGLLTPDERRRRGIGA